MTVCSVSFTSEIEKPCPLLIGKVEFHLFHLTARDGVKKRLLGVDDSVFAHGALPFEIRGESQLSFLWKNKNYNKNNENEKTQKKSAYLARLTRRLFGKVNSKED